MRHDRPTADELSRQGADQRDLAADERDRQADERDIAADIAAAQERLTEASEL